MKEAANRRMNEKERIDFIGLDLFGLID